MSTVKSDRPVQDKVSRAVAVGGFLISLAALGATVYNSHRDRETQVLLNEIRIREALDKAFDVLGGEGQTLWVSAAVLPPAERARLEEARRILENEVLLFEPKHRRGLELRGVYLARIGSLDKAIEQFEEVARLYPNSFSVYNNLGAALATKNQHEAACEHFSQSLELKEDYALSHNGLGHSLEQLGQLETALAHYLRAVEIDPAYAPGFNNLGGVYHKLDRHEEEEQAYRRATVLRGDFGEAWHNLALNLHELGRTPEAERALTRALELGVELPTEE